MMTMKRIVTSFNESNHSKKKKKGELLVGELASVSGKSLVLHRCG